MRRHMMSNRELQVSEALLQDSEQRIELHGQKS
jgi:hypothetical protein